MDLRNVGFSYPHAERPALEGVTALIPTGGVTAILGPNGSGKSTLLHLLLGLLQAQQGSVLVEGRPQGSYSRRELSQRVGLVPQNETLVFELSVLEYTLLGRAPYLDLLALPHEEDRAVAWEALESVGIAGLAYRPVTSLSGGEKQLATVARALAQAPAVLLLDEPTSHLDLANARRVLQVMAGLRAQGRTILWTTHDPNAASAIASDILLMRQGRVIAQGPLAEVLTGERLTETYGVPVRVIDNGGRPLVLVHE
ncbi:MAG: ABC transporter ATP-binding protein [Chloroflexi bacterium]|nr:ABC transporter ATP-binding protein [Chloroflexota bacterium]